MYTNEVFNDCLSLPHHLDLDCVPNTLGPVASPSSSRIESLDLDELRWRSFGVGPVIPEAMGGVIVPSVPSTSSDDDAFKECQLGHQGHPWAELFVNGLGGQRMVSSGKLASCQRGE